MTSFHRFAALPSFDGGAEASQLRRQAWTVWRRLLESQHWRSTPRGPRPPESGALTDALISAFGLTMRSVGLYHRGQRNTLAVRRVELQLACPGLPPEFDGFRILHVSDPHFDLCEGLAEAIAEAAAGSPADVCVLTGDYRAAIRGPHDKAVRALERLVHAITAPAGIWATLGNHDGVAMVEPIERLGIGLLINEAASLYRGTAKLRLVGLDDVHRFHTPLADEALAEHAPRRGDGFGIALVHSPDMAVAAARLGYGLYLCGHTHGGQVCLPGGRPVVTHCDSPRRYSRGLWRIGKMQGYTNCGAGASGVPLRYFSRSEIARLTLKAAPPVDQGGALR